MTSSYFINTLLWCRRTYDILLADAEPRPDVKNPEVGAQNSTGKCVLCIIHSCTINFFVRLLLLLLLLLFFFHFVSLMLFVNAVTLARTRFGYD